MNDNKVLISGGGIAGLTLGILLKEKGWDPLVIERDPALRTEGYLLFFFGTGWDVAERMGLTGDIVKVHYPIDSLEYVDWGGNPVFPALPFDRVRRAVGGKFAFLRRQDLERILFDRSSAAGVQVRFGTTIRSIHEEDNRVNVTFNDGTSDAFRLLFGADGIHSNVREMLFGPESRLERFLGYYAAGFHAQSQRPGLRQALSFYEQPGCAMWRYPIDDRHMDVLYIFRHDSVGRLPHEKRLAFVREQLKGCGQITERVLREASSGQIYFDSLTQIVMPSWHQRRAALLGDACGCLTLAAAQGSHMAMASAYVIARELERHRGDHQRAFPAYERLMKPIVSRKQEEAKRIMRLLVPSSRLQMMAQYPLLRLVFSGLFFRYFFTYAGVKSALTGYK